MSGSAELLQVEGRILVGVTVMPPGEPGWVQQMSRPLEMWKGEVMMWTSREGALRLFVSTVPRRSDLRAPFPPRC